MAKPRIMLVGLSLLIGLISMNASAVLTTEAISAMAEFLGDQAHVSIPVFGIDW